jgi:hypothetical protein
MTPWQTFTDGFGRITHTNVAGLSRYAHFLLEPKPVGHAHQTHHIQLFFGLTSANDQRTPRRHASNPGSVASNRLYQFAAPHTFVLYRLAARTKISLVHFARSLVGFNCLAEPGHGSASRFCCDWALEIRN